MTRPSRDTKQGLKLRTLQKIFIRKSQKKDQMLAGPQLDITEYKGEER